MATRRYTNNASGVLLAAITAGQTGLSVGAGQGALFPTLSGGDWFVVTVADTSGTYEIVKATARSSDYFTITRGQEGTSPSAFPIASTVQLRATAESFSNPAALPASPYVAGDILYATNTTSFTTLAAVADGKVLSSAGVGTAPAWSKVHLTNDTTSVLSAPMGGTGKTSFVAGDLLYASGGTVLSTLGIGTTNQVLRVSGGVPAWGSSVGTSKVYPIQQADFTTNTTSNVPQMIRVISSATVTANTPRVAWTAARFSGTTDMHLMWPDEVPANYTGSPAVTLTWHMASATGSRTVWKAAIAFVAAGASATTRTFLTATTGGATNGATLGSTRQITINLTTTGLSSATVRPMILMVGRDADAGSDVASGYADLDRVKFTWS